MIEQEPKKSYKWIWIFSVILVAAIVLLIGFRLKNTGGTTDLANLPQFIQADFIDLDRIYSISKFRSGSGHDFSNGSGEKCRSMKHYFNVQQSQVGEQLRSQNNGMPPAPDGKNDIPIYSPVDGKITTIVNDKTVGEQIYIQPTAHADIKIRLFHIYKLEGVEKGKAIKAGEKIGVIGQYQNTDIAITRGRDYLSYFEVMPDSIFAKYLARGVKDRSELIITKEYRDANPLKCSGEQFAVNYDADPNSGNFVFLSGYKASW